MKALCSSMNTILSELLQVLIRTCKRLVVLIGGYNRLILPYELLPIVIKIYKQAVMTRLCSSMNTSFP